jgi:hypothetical protein
VRFEVERVTIEPFDLRQPVKYDLVVDRLTHWFHTSREWIKKGILMDDLYVFNNPWSIQANEKHTSYCAMMKLGMPIPETWMIPPKGYIPSPDVKPTLQRYARLFDLGKVGDTIGWPMFLKPYDGGGWRAVTRVKNAQEAWKAYEESDTAVMHAQASVEGYDRFVRTIGFGPQTHNVLYNPDAPLHDRYTMETNFLSREDAEHLRKVTLTINAFFGWDFNSCESLRKGSVWHPIDFANPCPDSQVTSLHFHFPWMVKSYLRWSIFCAATKRKMRAPSTGSPSTPSPRWTSPTPRSSTATPPSRTRASRRRASRTFCATHLRAPRRRGRALHRAVLLRAPRPMLMGVAMGASAVAALTPEGGGTRSFLPAHEVGGESASPELLFWQAHPARGARRGVPVSNFLKSRWYSQRIGCEATVARWGTSGSRCWCSRPRGATPRRSSASR